MFYDNFVKLCEARGEKPTPVAKKLGCSSSNVALWKKGSTPRAIVLNKMADYFGVTTQHLLFGDTDNPSTEKAPGQEAEGKLVEELPEDIQQLISVCRKNPGIASALLNLARQIEKGQAAQG